MSEHRSDFRTREKLHRQFFDPHSRTGHQFEVLSAWMIILSVATVTLETVAHLDERYETLFNAIEWVFTIIFTLEFFLRLYTAPDRIRYLTSFFGIVDLLSILPTYIGIFLPGKQSLLIIRILRLLRMFRIFKMGHFVNEGAVVISALKASRVKIVVFVTFILICSVFMGAMMYMIEQDINPNIQNIPEGIYWAIVTLTTVGYGDSIPITPLGKMLATIVMIMGYGVIAVPTGIVTAEITNRVMAPRGRDLQICERCGHNDHLKNSRFCHHCGERMPQ
jgi:voltage-gated potassium channel